MGQDRESLRDLDGVRVAVEALSAGATALGLAAADIKRSAEGQLRQAGITVLGIGDFPVGDPFLRIRVDATSPSNGLVAFRVDIDFVQMTFMRRNPAVTFNRAQTWLATPQLGLVEVTRAASVIVSTIGEDLEQFIRDYRAVN